MPKRELVTRKCSDVVEVEDQARKNFAHDINATHKHTVRQSVRHPEEASCNFERSCGQEVPFRDHL